jgi:hypothetical protein
VPSVRPGDLKVNTPRAVDESTAWWVFPRRPATAPPSHHSCAHRRPSSFDSPQPNVILSLRQVQESNADILGPIQNGGSGQYGLNVLKDNAYVIWGRVSPSATGLSSSALASTCQPATVWSRSL